VSKKARTTNPRPPFVTREECVQQHVNVAKEIGEVKIDLRKVVNTLMGEEVSGSLKRKGGIVGDLAEIKEKLSGRLSGKDKAYIVASFIVAVSSIIIAILK